MCLSDAAFAGIGVFHMSFKGGVSVFYNLLTVLNVNPAGFQIFWELIFLVQD